jgi:tetratricopeptide (TPR) repeat protein
MPIQKESDLPSDARSMWLKAVHAIELKNFGYAVPLIESVLRMAPGFLDGRKTLRKAEIALTKGKKNFFGGLSTVSIKGGRLLKTDPNAAMDLAEKELEGDPYNTAGNQLLRDAALAAGYPEIAIFALETIVEGNPKDTKAMHELGQLYYELGDPDKAVDIYTRIVTINPADLIAVKRSKDASAKSSMSKGGWTEVAQEGSGKDYRDLIKNKDEAVSLEQQSRVVMSDDMIDNQLAELGQRYEQEPKNLDVVRKIAQLYEQKGEDDSAMQWFEYAASLTGGTDPMLERKVSDYRMKILDRDVTSIEEQAAANPDSEEVRAQLDAKKKERAAAFISEARVRVERNPTDLQYRYELGEQLIAAGEFTDAIPELQRARQNPNVRIKAMNLLGQCYTGKGMLDFAVKTYTEAAKEVSGMDNTKKEIVYKLGLVLEQMGKKEEALEAFKQIYEVDYGYEDVAKRVESSYE